MSSSLNAFAPERAIIKITNFAQDPDWGEPWRFSRVSRGTGSGFVIEGNRIMTNAHVVSLSRQILVQRYQDPKQYVARIEHIGHDCDLAVLTVDDPTFFEDITPFVIGDFPVVRSTVTTYGYPSGGQQISFTRGVISRIETRQYVHIQNRSLLTVQTDAAINPGNSGGPAVQDGKVVGVSFQGNPMLENAGFFIPPNVVRHFLEDIEDGTYDGFPDGGIRVTSLHNPAFRRALGLPDDDVGARIDAIFHPFPKTHELLKPNDVLLAVSGYEVGSDGMIQYEGNRVSASVMFDEIQHGNSIQLKIWRHKAAIDIELPLFVNREDRVSGNQYYAPPYLIVGGLVFTELSRNYLRSLGRDWRKHVSPETIYQLFYRAQQDEATARSNPIIFSRILKHPTNVDFGVNPHGILTEVNGREIGSISDLSLALEESTDAFHRFKFQSGREEALRIDAAQAADSELLIKYNIPSAYRLEPEYD
jgi:S1-C subfamily serine protease